MMKGKRIVLSTFGSFGDVHPYIAIALELRARGASPSIATSEIYREKMDAVGLELHPVRPDLPSYDQPEEISRMLEELMNPRTGSEKVISTLVTPYLRETYDDLMAAVRGADLLLSHPLPLVGPLVAEQTGIKWASSVLAPLSLFSVYDPPVPPQFPALYHLLKLSPLVARAVMKLARWQLRALAEPVYRLRAQLGLRRGGHPILEGQHSPRLVLALYSSVLGAPEKDSPPNLRITGFPFYDRRDREGDAPGLPAGMSDFLDAGEPPIVFTLGSSAIWVAKDFYTESIAAARALGRRALLLIGDERNLPREALPDDIAAFDYAPYSEVLPRACAVVHQGGVGTTGQSLRAGRPMLVVPFSHDQFDNGARVARLGAGRVLPRSRYNAQSATDELRKLLQEPVYAQKATEVGRLVRQEDGTRVACDALEEVLGDE